MAVRSVRELPRTYEREVAKAGTAIRRWVVDLSDNTLENNATNAAAIFAAAEVATFGQAHPDPFLSGWKLRKVYLAEGYENNPYLVLVTGEYSIVRDEEILAPVNRPPQWSFEGQSIEVPALFYYDGAGNGTQRPLTNSAYDYFPGLTTQEFAVRARVVRNFANLPAAQVQATNAVNSDTYLGAAPHSWRCAGVSINYTYEEYAGAMLKYWAMTAELVFRASTWNLLLPDVGWNFIDSGQKRRAMVFDFRNGEWVASPNPVGLNGGGAQTLGAPAILTRRVAPEVNFLSLFGAPPP